MSVRSILCLLALALTTAAPFARQQERPTFATQSELVVLHVAVEDRKGTYVSGLPQSAFTVYEDGQQQEVQFFSAADTPATIGVIVDNSTSMWNRREMVVAAAIGFTQLSNSEDEVFVLAFNEDVTEIWKPTLIRDTNPSRMRFMLLAGIGARGKTALYDAIKLGLTRLETGRHTRQVLVLISDGDDNASTAKVEDVLDMTRQAEAAIFTVALRDPSDKAGNPKLLKRLASETGGEAFEPQTLEDLPETLEHIARDIRSAYSIGYAPQASSAGRALRKLRVNVRGQNGRPLHARTRGGYVARAAS